MYIYYRISNEEIYKILSSLIININDNIVHSKIVMCENDILVRIKLKNNESSDLIRINKNTFLINKIFNLENRNIKFYFNNKEVLKSTKNSLKFLKEIKIDENLIDEYFEYHNGKATDCKIYNHSSIDILTNENNTLYVKNNILKGMIYGALLDYNFISEYLLKNYGGTYEEYKLIINIINDLRFKNELNKNLYKVLNKTRSEFQKNIENKLNSANFENMIINKIELNKIELNNNFLQMTKEDLLLFERIINILVNKLYYIENSKNKIEQLLKLLSIDYKDSEKLNIKEDLSLLQRRFINEDYSINVNYINSVVLKNLFVVCIKYNNDREFVSFIDEKHIDRYYIAYMILGAVKGIGDSSYSLFSVDKQYKKIINDSINFLEKNLLEAQEKIYINRLKIQYYLNNIYSISEKVNFENKDFKIISNEKGILKIWLKRDTSSMNVMYHTRNKNISKNIKYYDNRNNDLIKINKNYKAKNIYFSYYFIINNKKKALDYRYENIYSNILKYFYNERNSCNERFNTVKE